MSEEKTAVVFYCKDCSGLIFACVNIPERLKDKDIRKEITGLMKRGYKLAEVPMDNVRDSSSWCKCNE